MECAIDNEFFAGNFPAKLCRTSIYWRGVNLQHKLCVFFSWSEWPRLLIFEDAWLHHKIYGMRLFIFEIQRAGQQISISDQLAQKTFERTMTHQYTN